MHILKESQREIQVSGIQYVTEKLVKLLYELTFKQNVRKIPHNLSIPSNFVNSDE